MATYVCSDIHGMFREFIELLKKINFSKDDKLYVLGDAIDRGPNSIDTIKFIMETENIEMIIGNHELAMLDYYRGNWALESWADHEWFTFGGKTTHKEMRTIDKETKNKILDYIENLPYYIKLDNFLLVHGGFDIYDKENPKKNEITLEEALKINNRETTTWNRDFFESDKKITGYKTIVGHTPTLCFNKEDIIFKENTILIDCGCIFGGKLACLRLEDMKEFYI